MLKQRVLKQCGKYRYRLEADAPVLTEVVRVYNHLFDLTRPPGLIDPGLDRAAHSQGDQRMLPGIS